MRLRIAFVAALAAFLLALPVWLLAQTPPVPVVSAWSMFIHSAFAAGAIAGWLPVVLVDYQAFRAFKSLQEAESYDWKTAVFRWGQGLIGGGLAATLFKAVVS